MTTKLLFFVVEKAAEPFASALEQVCLRSPTFQRACIATARPFNTRSPTRRASAYADPNAPVEKLVPLTDTEATKLGAELIGEAAVWSIGLAILYAQHRQESEAEAELEARIQHLEATISAQRAAAALPPPPPRPPLLWRPLAAGGGGGVFFPSPTS